MSNSRCGEGKGEKRWTARDNGVTEMAHKKTKQRTAPIQDRRHHNAAPVENGVEESVNWIVSNSSVGSLTSKVVVWRWPLVSATIKTVSRCPPG